MKINWGTGIVITLVVFVGCMVLLIWISMNQRLNLVTENYYPDGIKYDQQMNKLRNTNQLKEKVKLELIGENVEITFPKIDSISKPSGVIVAFRPSDNRLDKKFDIVTDNNLKQQISIQNFLVGVYVFKVDWSQNGKEYYQEFNLNF